MQVTASFGSVISCYDNSQINFSFLTFLNSYQKNPVKEIEGICIRVSPPPQLFVCNRSAVSTRINNILRICVRTPQSAHRCQWSRSMLEVYRKVFFSSNFHSLPFQGSNCHSHFPIQKPLIYIPIPIQCSNPIPVFCHENSRIS